MFDWREEWQVHLQQDEDSWVVKAEGSLILEGNLFQYCKYAIHIYRENISPPEIARLHKRYMQVLVWMHLY